MIDFKLKAFNDLSNLELHDLLKLRTDVFVVEQECAYQEIDGHDLKSLHLLGFVNNELVACARLCPPKSVYFQASIGRVTVKESHRGKQYGKKLFDTALKHCKKTFPQSNIKIQAQQYLELFYSSFGFKTISKPYLDFGIWHVDMLLTV